MRLVKIIVSFALIICTLTASVMILPESTVSVMTVHADTQKLTVTANQVNVRSGAGTSYSKITLVNKGDVFTVLGTAKDSSSNTWYKISVNGKTGYIISTYAKVETVTATAATTAKPAASGTITAKSAAGAYAQPTKSSAKSATMTKGAVYNYTAVYTGGDGVVWYLAKVGGATGWVCSSDVTLGGTVASSTTKKTTATTAKPATSGTLTAKSAAGAYAQPTKSSAKSATMTAGAVYNYTAVYTGGDGVKWYLAKVGNSTGWVCSSDVTLGGTAASSTTSSSTTKTTTTTKPATSGTLTAKSAAGAYAQPTKSSAKSATMTKGAVYNYTAVYTGGDGVKWYLAKVGNSTGWVCSSDVTLGGTITSSTTSSSTTKTTTTTKPATSGTLTAKSAAGAYAQPTKSTWKAATMTAGTAYNYTAVYTGGDGVKWYLASVNGVNGWVCSSDVTLGGTVTSASSATSSTQSTTSSTTQSSTTESTSATQSSTTESTTSTTKTTTTTSAVTEGVRANSAVTVYSNPTTTSTKITTLETGKIYAYSSTYVGGDNVTWYLVEPEEGYRGWVSSAYVTKISPSSTSVTTTVYQPPNGSASTTTIKTGTIKTGGSTLRVRASASTSAAVLGQLANGASVVITGQTTGPAIEGTNVWYKISYNNSNGYISAAYVTNIKTTTQSVSISFGASYYYVNIGSTVSAAISGVSGITYTSSDPTNAPISASGVITGKKAGVYKITATYGGASATADVVVLAKPNNGISQMSISDQGTAFIAGWEGGGTYVSGLGTVFYPYKDVSGYWTVGYGHAKTTTASKSWSEATAIAQFNIDITNLIGEEHILTETKPYLTQEEATILLNADLNNGPYVTAVSDWAIRNGVKLNQQQFDALVSFCFNLGPAYWTNDSTKFYLKSAIISHRDGSLANANQIIDGFTRYMKSGGLNYKGLWWRRRNEAEMFISGDYNIDRGEKFPLPTNITWA